MGAGETLVHDGAWHAGCYLLLTGAVVTTTGEGPRLITIAGEFVGLPETLADVAAHGDTVTMRASRLLVFSTSAFRCALDSITSLRRLALRQLAIVQVASRQPTPATRVLAMAPTT